MTTERRRYPRYDIMAQIRVADDEETYILDVDNISMTGIFILVEDVDQLPWPKLGQRVDMDIFTTNDLDNIHLQGLIVRISKKGNNQKSGFGASFVGTGDGAREKLTRLVAQAAEKSLHPPPLP